MKIFISHSHEDSESAKSLVDMLLCKLSLVDDDIRCTSVPGHQLPFGKNIADLLKKDINLSPAILALISTQSLRSDWVMFELGAAWGLDKVIYPILGPKVELKNLPGPLGHLPCIEIESLQASSRTSDLLQQLAVELELTQKNGGKAQATLEEFINQYRSNSRNRSITNNSQETPEDLEEKVLLVLWNKDASEYDRYGYSLESLAQSSKLINPKCQHILNALIKKGFVERKTYSGGVNGDRYTLKDEGRQLLLEKNLVE